MGFALDDGRRRFVMVETPDGQRHILAPVETVGVASTLLGAVRYLFPSPGEYREAVRRARAAIFPKLEIFPISPTAEPHGD